MKGMIYRLGVFLSEEGAEYGVAWLARLGYRIRKIGERSRV